MSQRLTHPAVKPPRTLLQTDSSYVRRVILHGAAGSTKSGLYEASDG
jgi:hypothetical protein